MHLCYVYVKVMVMATYPSLTFLLEFVTLSKGGLLEREGLSGRGQSR